MKRFLILPALCLFLAAHRAVAALTYLGHGGLHRRQLLKSLGTRDLRRDPAPLLRRYFSALHGPLITRSLAAVSLARYR